MAITFLLLRALFPKVEPVPTIPWGTLTPAATLASPTVSAAHTITPECTPGAAYVDDVTIPDGTVLSPGETFLKAWRVRNAGSCPWGADYALRYVSGEQMGGASSVSIPSALPGETAEISVPLTAPLDAGPHRGDWQLCTGDGECFGATLYVQIAVEAASVLEATPTAEATSGAAPATAITEPSASPLPDNPGASEWLVNGSRALGVRELAWDTELSGLEADSDEIYLSLYIVAISTGGPGAIFSPLEISVVDGEGEIRETLILERRDPPFSLCTAGPGTICEGWWTTAITDRNRTKRTLTLRWEPSLLSVALETPIWQ